MILKATESCNLRCRYCYNCETDYRSELLSRERLEKLFTLLASGYNCVNIVWHGGEPLLCGIDYLSYAAELEDELYRSAGVPFINSIQTNATLITSEWIRFFKKYRFKLGISFDGIRNSEYRQQSEKVQSVLRLLQRRKLPFGCLAVVADDSYDMIENYKFFRDRGIHFALSPMFCEGGGEKLPALTAKVYAKNIKELFLYWLYDTKGVNIRLFTDYISMLFHSSTRTCTNGSCHGKWLGVTPDGNLYNCGRSAIKRFCFGNIDDIETISEAFSGEGFRELLVSAIARRNKCKESCAMFEYCQSGCSDCAMIENGLENIPSFSCETFREIFPFIRDEMQRVLKERIPLSKLNPAVRATMMRLMAE